jgi:hypothetical protein
MVSIHDKHILYGLTARVLSSERKGLDAVKTLETAQSITGDGGIILTAPALVQAYLTNGPLKDDQYFWTATASSELVGRKGDGYIQVIAHGCGPFATSTGFQRVRERSGEIKRAEYERLGIDRKQYSAPTLEGWLFDPNFAQEFVEQSTGTIPIYSIDALMQGEVPAEIATCKPYIVVIEEDGPISVLTHSATTQQLKDSRYFVATVGTRQTALDLLEQRGLSEKEVYKGPLVHFNLEEFEANRACPSTHGWRLGFSLTRPEEEPVRRYQCRTTKYTVLDATGTQRFKRELQRQAT